MNDTKRKVIFAPGCFDDFEGSQEELDDLVNEIEKMFENDDFMEHTRLLTEEDIDEMDDETIEKIINAIEDEENKDNVIEVNSITRKKLH